MRCDTHTHIVSIVNENMSELAVLSVLKTFRYFGVEKVRTPNERKNHYERFQRIIWTDTGKSMETASSETLNKPPLLDEVDEPCCAISTPTRKANELRNVRFSEFFLTSRSTRYTMSIKMTVCCCCLHFANQLSFALCLNKDSKVESRKTKDFWED